MTDTDSQTEYFNLPIKGLGYLNRFREVKASNGRRYGYHAVEVCAMEGPTNRPNYTRFDAIISGAEALEVLKGLETEILDKKTKVLAGFNLGGVTPNIYTVKQGDKAGEQRVSLKSRLLRIGWVKVKGPSDQAYETVYTAPAPEEDATQEQENQGATAS